VWLFLPIFSLCVRLPRRPATDIVHSFNVSMLLQGAFSSNAGILMTTLAFWAGYDNHGTTSIYIATDSRFTYINPQGKIVEVRDNCQKTFYSPLTPDIFGIYGVSVGDFHEIISVLLGLLSGFRLEYSTAEEYICFVSEAIRHTIVKRNLKGPNGHIIHGFRWGPTADFVFVEYLICEATKKVNVTAKEIEIKTHEGFDGSYKKISELVSFCYPRASGSDSLYAVIRDDKEISQRGFCRWHWQVFCDHINDPKDDYTGGVPQLVGLYKKWNGINFGVYFNSVPYATGKAIGHAGLDLIPDDIRWHDELFQRIDKYGEIIPGAQRHARIMLEPNFELLIT
jgi:hypothetical protein